jgi:hypothetical protein
MIKIQIHPEGFNYYKPKVPGRITKFRVLKTAELN